MRHYAASVGTPSKRTPPPVLRDLHRPHRPREVTARGHPVPQLVEVVPASAARTPDADRCSSTPGAPLLAWTFSHASQTQALSDLKRLHPATSARAPGSSGPAGLAAGLTLGCPAPSLQPHYRTFTATTGRSAPVPRTGTLPLAVSAACGPPSRRPGQHLLASAIGATGSPVPCQRLQPSSRHLYTGHHQASTQAARQAHATRRPLSREFCAPPVLMPSFRYRRVSSGSLTFVFSPRT